MKTELNINETSIWKTLKNTEKPIILYGTGNGADKVLDEMQKLKLPISGIFVSDDFVRGQTFRGFKVQKLSYFSEIYDAFIVCVAF